MPTRLIYLDCNATTPVDPRVRAAMLPFLSTSFGNPSSGHALGRAARSAVENAREQVARAIGAHPDEIYFTSGGTEADNWAIRGLLAARSESHAVTTAVEHPAVLEPLRELEQAGRVRLTVLPVDGEGRLSAAEAGRALMPETVLVSVMVANNEVGTLQPVAELAAPCRRIGALLHSDAAQAVGKILVDVRRLGVDLLTIAGHKLYAPKGVGALFVRRGVALAPLLRGAGHERGLRAGTENVAGIVGLGLACEIAVTGFAEEAARLGALRNRLEELLADGFPTLVRHGHRVLRLPNTASVAFPGIEASALLERLAERLGASAGAACHGHTVHPSHVLAAMGVDPAAARGTVRFSLGRFTTEREVVRAAAKVLTEARRMARAQGAPVRRR
jgi:cysteine desulfurase